eukprot:GHVO01066549.1.p1 GENE.GHVO01066549.1~~GHVO01066549.1.p1  ORF type:complete len:131 (-),score=3.29 GHVO01066549.1:280-672(-)
MNMNYHVLTLSLTPESYKWRFITKIVVYRQMMDYRPIAVYKTHFLSEAERVGVKKPNMTIHVWSGECNIANQFVDLLEMESFRRFRRLGFCLFTPTRGQTCHWVIEGKPRCYSERMQEKVALGDTEQRKP